MSTALTLELDISRPTASPVEAKYDADTKRQWDAACSALQQREQRDELLAIWQSVPEDGRLELVDSIVAQEGLTALEQAVSFLRVDTARALLQIMGASVQLDLERGDRSALLSNPVLKDARNVQALHTSMPFLAIAAFRSPFMCAVASNHVELARLLLEHGARTDLDWQHALSFFSRASRGCKLPTTTLQDVDLPQLLYRLLELFGISVAPLIRAAGHVLPRLVQTVIGDCTTLHIAAALGAVDSIKFLIEECKFDVEADSAVRTVTVQLLT